jgi:hypothetical protein
MYLPTVQAGFGLFEFDLVILYDRFCLLNCPFGRPAVPLRGLNLFAEIADVQVILQLFLNGLNVLPYLIQLVVDLLEAVEAQRLIHV